MHLRNVHSIQLKNNNNKKNNNINNNILNSVCDGPMK